MKSYITTFLIMSGLFSSILAQTSIAPESELCVQTFNPAYTGQTVEFVLNPVSIEYCQVMFSDCTFNQTELGIQNTTITGETISAFYGFALYHCGSTTSLPPFTRSLYRLDVITGINNEIRQSVYIDFRDPRYGDGNSTMCLSCNSVVSDRDMTIRYNATNNIIYVIEGINTSSSLAGFTILNQNEVINIWELIYYDDHPCEDWGNVLRSFPVLYSPTVYRNQVQLNWLKPELSENEFIRYFVQRMDHPGSSFHTIALITDYNTQTYVDLPDLSSDLLQYRIAVDYNSSTGGSKLSQENRLNIGRDYSNIQKIEQIPFLKKPIKTIKNKTDISFYPNPFNSKVKLKVEMPGNIKLNLYIYDITGNNLFQRKIISDNSAYELSFDFRNFASGIYFYKILYINEYAEPELVTGKLMHLK